MVILVVRISIGTSCFDAELPDPPEATLFDWKRRVTGRPVSRVPGPIRNRSYNNDFLTKLSPSVFNDNLYSSGQDCLPFFPAAAGKWAEESTFEFPEYGSYLIRSTR